MSIERIEKKSDKEVSTKQILGVIVGGIIASVALSVGVAECLPPTSGCAEKKTPQEVQDCINKDPGFSPVDGQHCGS